VKWRALAVAVACLSTALWACSFQKEWEAYCAHPGRCARFDAGDNDTIQIAQGSSNRKILLGGQYLEGATVSLNPADSGMVSVVPVVPAVQDGILLDVTVKHGVGVGERLTVHFHWDRDSEDQDSIPLVVTPITATADPIADDDAGFGTPLNPYRTLLRASQHSDTGDIIHLGAGTFSSICTTSPGLKLGVTVEGEPGLPDGGGRSMVEGPGPCGFTLSDPAQALRLVTISNFDAGLVATADAGRPTASGVTVTSCDTGVVVSPGGQLLLEGAHLTLNGEGLVVNGGDAVVQGGVIDSSARNGVLMKGTGGSLSLTGTGVNGNAPSTGDEVTGAGVLIASSGGTATIGSLIIANNGQTAVTVAGNSNLVTFDAADLRGGFIGLVVQDPGAGVSMRNTTFQFCPTAGLKVEGLASFNGGTGDGGYGHNAFSCGSTEIWDARTSNGPDMDFADTRIRGQLMDAGVDIGASSAQLGITVGSAQNPIHFH